MTTIIRSSGRILGIGDGTLVEGPITPYGKLLGIKAVRSTNIDPAAGVTIPFEYALYDTGGFIFSYPSTEIWIPQDGLYSIVGYVNTTSDTAHTGLLQININGVEIRSRRNTFNAAGGLMNALCVGLSSYPMSRGWYIQMRWDSNGTSLAMQTGGEPGCSLAVWRVG